MPFTPVPKAGGLGRRHQAAGRSTRAAVPGHPLGPAGRPLPAALLPPSDAAGSRPGPESEAAARWQGRAAPGHGSDSASLAERRADWLGAAFPTTPWAPAPASCWAERGRAGRGAGCVCCSRREVLEAPSGASSRGGRGAVGPPPWPRECSLVNSALRGRGGWSAVDGALAGRGWVRGGTQRPVLFLWSLGSAWRLGRGALPGMHRTWRQSLGLATLPAWAWCMWRALSRNPTPARVVPVHERSALCVTASCPGRSPACPLQKGWGGPVLRLSPLRRWVAAAAEAPGLWLDTGQSPRAGLLRSGTLTWGARGPSWGLRSLRGALAGRTGASEALAGAGVRRATARVTPERGLGQHAGRRRSQPFPHGLTCDRRL